MEEQAEVVKTITAGHNLLLTGQAGTGKTSLIRKIIGLINDTGKKTAVVCPTGIAATQYAKEGASTVHRWAGLYDGRFSDAELTEMFTHDNAFLAVRKNVASTDVLIIDEISMLSLRTFHQLELICRLGGKNTDMLFGGLQLIACGDFFQLRPVSDTYFPDSKRYCFESDMWNRLFPHHITLTEIHRTSDESLIKAVHDTATGQMTDETSTFLLSLSRPLRTGTNAICLYATNHQADVLNSEMVLNHPGTPSTYVAVETGPVRLLKRITAPHRLLLKVGVPVLLLRNLSEQLVNGMRGQVTALRETEVDVFFKQINQVHTVSPILFNVYDPHQRRNIASRSQLPLRLAFGITIHKAQGMTLEFVKVDCRGIQQPGQLSVAISRASSRQGLQVIGYTPSVVKKHPPEVYNITQRISEPLQEDKRCCKQYYIPSMESDECFDEMSSGSSTDTAAETSDVEMLQITPSDVVLPTGPKEGEKVAGTPTTALCDVAKALTTAHEFTEHQVQRNRILMQLSDTSSSETWYQNQVSAIQKMFKEAQPGFPKCDPKMGWNNFCTSLFKYLNGSVFGTSLPELFTGVPETTTLPDIRRQVAVDIVMYCRDVLLSQAARQTTESSELPPVHQKTVPAIGKAKIRDLAGMCVARARARYLTHVSHYLFKADEMSLNKVREGQQKIDMLRTLEESETMTATEDPTASIVLNKMRCGRPLTLVSKACLNYFLLVTDIIRRHLTVSNLAIHKHNLLCHIASLTQRDTHLRSAWVKALPGKGEISENIRRGLTNTFIKVFGKQFRKDALDKLKIKKKKALRKTLEEKSTDHSGSVQNDLHVLLRQKISNNPEFLCARQVFKKDLCMVCRAYNITTKNNDTKLVLINKISDRLKVCVGPANESLIPPSIAALVGYSAVSTSQGKGKGKGKGKKSQETLKYFCTVCGKEYVDGVEDWVECGRCKGWVDRTCAGLLEEEDWEEVCMPDVEFVCPTCSPPQNQQ